MSAPAEGPQPKPEDAVLCLRKVTKTYATASSETPVLRSVDLEVTRGQAVGIVGPSGSGKSTLLNILGTLDHPTTGEVRFEGQDPFRLAEQDLARLRNQKIGFVFQLHHLLPQLNVIENVLVPTLARVGEQREAADRARKLLDGVGLSHRLTHRPSELSAGERQRVAVVRALINRPSVLLADEPTGSLDRSAAEDLGRLLEDLNREQKLTLVVVTHSTALAQRMGAVWELGDGSLCASR